MDPMMKANAVSERHYVHSVLRERIAEHMFVGEALRTLWRRNITDVELLRSEFDAGGYDLVMSLRAIVRHIQLKVSMEAGRVPVLRQAIKLMEKPTGCILWIAVAEDLELRSFLFGTATSRESHCHIRENEDRKSYSARIPALALIPMDDWSRPVLQPGERKIGCMLMRVDVVGG